MPRKSKKKPAQEPVPGQQTEQPPASAPAAEPIMKIAQPVPSEIKPITAEPAETNPTAALSEAKIAEVAPQLEPTAAPDPEKIAAGTITTAAATILPSIQPKEEIVTLKPIETNNILAKTNAPVTAIERQPIYGAIPKRELPKETDPNQMTDELRNAVMKLKHPRADVKIEWIAWISGMNNASAAVPSLIRLLTDQEDTVRSNTAWGLGRIGKDAKTAVPFLLDALNDRCSDVRRFAAMALGEIGDPSAIGPLNALAKMDKDWTLRQTIGTALKKLR